jgi:excinuclease ABC subunit C
LLALIENLPESSGVYQYFDKNNKLLYIGKAKNLKKRVKNYFKLTPTLTPSNKLNSRQYKMISETENIEYIVVENENDALILENSLIKQLKPKYNILLRDDKTYPYIFIDLNEKFPRFEITRKIIASKNIKYFGPFPSGSRDLLSSIYEISPLVQKKSCIKGNKACLFYQIKKCLAPCENKITKSHYSSIVENSMRLINNKKELLKILTLKMNSLSNSLRFEEALSVRDKIASIKKTEIKSSVDLTKNDNLDIFTATQNKKQIVIVKMFVRDGKIVSSDYNIVKNNENINWIEIYKRAILNLYKDSLPLAPNEILLSSEIKDIEDLKIFLFARFGKHTPIVVPRKGNKLKLIEIGLKNCKRLLSRDKEEDIKQKLQDTFGLSNYPNRIEVFDNSHMFGQSIVGSMVVYEDGFIRSDYRKFHLNSRDEYGQSKELLAMRIEKLYKNSPPDLWLIDGGKTLLILAKEIVKNSGANIDVISIAKEKIGVRANRSKGRARDIVYFDNQAIKLPTNDKRLHFIQKLRDEAHRFAISFHRAIKLKEDKQISLLQITGIGRAKIKKLIDYFNSFENIKNASNEELAKILNKIDAKNIKQFFHNS